MIWQTMFHLHVKSFQVSEGLFGWESHGARWRKWTTFDINNERQQENIQRVLKRWHTKNKNKALQKLKDPYKQLVRWWKCIGKDEPSQQIEHLLQLWLAVVRVQIDCKNQLGRCNGINRKLYTCDKRKK